MSSPSFIEFGQPPFPRSDTLSQSGPLKFQICTLLTGRHVGGLNKSSNMAVNTMLCNFRKQKQKPTQPRMIFRRCTIFRLVKPAFFRYNGIFALVRLLLLSSGNVERNPGPESISPTGNFKLITVKGLRICHLNVPSLVNKIDEIRVFCETQLPHVLSFM